ncbi:MAG: response regulator [Chloroflexi bacterium]|nr:response regulator [Chloroflexota bacterium]
MTIPYALVVEDEPLVAELFRRALQDAGYQAEIMDNGHKAQAQLVFTNPEIVLLDMNLPSLSGSVLLRQIRGQRRLSGTHVVVVTGDKEAAEQFTGEADQVLIKPVGYEQVREVAGRYLHAMV